MQDVFVIGLALFPAANAVRELRLEEMAWRTVRAALDSSRVTRSQVDSLTIGACDELDGRPISSMLMSAPSGGYLTDEIKVTDSGASALAFAHARFLAEETDLGLVVSWCKSSKTDVEKVMRLRGDPFYTRPLDLGAIAADAMFAQAMQSEFGLTTGEVNERVAAAYLRASRNPRGMCHAAIPAREVGESSYDAVPVRTAQRAPLTDGACALVLASSGFLRRNPQCKALARLAGVAWNTDSYRIDSNRLHALSAARAAWSDALGRAGLRNANDFDVIELEAPTGWHEAAFVRAFGIERADTVSPSGGAFAQNPIFCNGLVNAAEAVLQVAGQAGPVQLLRVRRAAAHGCHGLAQQGHVVAVFETPGVAA
jgi:hypothetical protein